MLPDLLEVDLSFLKELRQMGPGDVQHVGRLLGRQHRPDRYERDHVAAGDVS